MDSRLLNFIQTSFKSVWALEVLLLLRRHSDRAWSPKELVRELRGSAPVVAQSVVALQSAGLIAEGADSRVQFAPASQSLRELVDAVEETYIEKPDAVRRVILMAPNEKLLTLADAFRLRKGKQ